MNLVESFGLRVLNSKEPTAIERDKTFTLDYLIANQIGALFVSEVKT